MERFLEKSSVSSPYVAIIVDLTTGEQLYLHRLCILHDSLTVLGRPYPVQLYDCLRTVRQDSRENKQIYLPCPILRISGWPHTH
jgi:hypothetical protein